MAVLTDPADATPAWLSHALGRAVAAVEARPSPAFNSSITHLVAHHDRGEPTKLVLKLNRDNWGEAEVGVYQLAMAATATAPVPSLVPCYAAAHDPTTGTSHLLLRDLSDSHAAPVTRAQVLALDAVPPDARLHAMTDALADFHAHWWDHPSFGGGVLQPPTIFRTPAAMAERVAQRQAQFRHFADTAGPTVDPDTLRLAERALAGLPALWADRYGRRFAAMRDLTLVNGDCYFAQFLCPRDGSASPTYLLDFQEASVHLPAEDLVFMFATFWMPAQRHEGDRERRLLDRYRARLAAHGITYTADQLLDDYRVGIVYQLFRTIWDQSVGAPESYWRPKLDCVVASFRDHDCDRL